MTPTNDLSLGENVEVNPQTRLRQALACMASLGIGLPQHYETRLGEYYEAL